MVWYYADGDRQRGPISDEEFQEMVNRGRISTETLIWKDGMDSWQPLKNASEAGLITISPVSTLDAPLIVPALTHGTDALSVRNSAAVGSFCAQCGRGPMPDGTEVRVGNLMLCYTCNNDMSRHYQATGSGSQAMSGFNHVPGNAINAETLPYAGITQRLGAVIIDNVVGSVVVNLALMMLSLQSSTPPTIRQIMDDPESMMAMLLPSLVASLIFTFLYNAVLIALFSATLGKMAFRIKVSKPDGSRVSPWQAIVRAGVPPVLIIATLVYPGSLLGVVGVLVYMGGFAIALFDGQRRTLYDHLASTRVIRNQ